MDLTDLLAATKDVNAAITQIDQKLRKPSSSTPAPVVEQASTDDAEELGDVAHVSSHGYVASHRCLAVVRPSNSVELVDLDGGASTVLMEAPSQAAVAARALTGGEVLVVAAWGDACARWRLARDGAGWRVVAPRKTCAGLAAAGTVLVAAMPAAAENSYIARCAGTVVDVLENEGLASIAHFSVGGAGRALAWDFGGDALAVAGAGGLTIWGPAPETETVIPTPCRCVAATGSVIDDEGFVCVADAGLLTREEARADDMKVRASDGYVGRAETRDTGFGGGLIPAGLLVGAGAAPGPPEAPRPTASLVTFDDNGQWRVALTARIDALPRGVAVVDAVAAVGDAVAVASSFDPQRAVAVFAAADLAPRPAVRLGGGDGRVRALANDGGRLAAVVVARAGAPPLCAAGARGPAPGAARRVVVDLAPPPPPPPAPPAPPTAPSSVTDRLATLASLRASGALTEAEFARAKALELGLPAP